MDIQLTGPDTTRAFSSRTTATPLAPKELDEATSLEYSLLKVPYEMLNRKYRVSLKKLGKLDLNFAKQASDILDAFPNGNECIPVDDVAEKLVGLTKKLAEFTETFESCMKEQGTQAHELLGRAEYLSRGLSGTPQDIDLFRRQRMYRLLIDHLLRVGYFDTAQKLASRTGVEPYTNQDVFQVAKLVESSLRDKEFDAVLQWIADNRSKLHRLNSNFEQEIHIQQVVELAKVGQQMEARELAQKHFGGLFERSKWEGNLLTMLGLIGIADHFGSFPDTKYAKLASDDRWLELVEMFRMENAAIFNISALSPFSACFQLGICAHKTPHCKEDSTSRCVVCKDLFNFSLGLPHSNISISRLICPHRGELISEHNVPMMLPNGRVYGENALHELTKNDEVFDPKDSSYHDLRLVKRVFIL